VSTKKVVWSQRAKQSLKAHHDYIKQDSVAAAKRVKSEIIKAAEDLSQHPEKYQVDEYYPNNSGNIRRFFRWSYRIVYQIKEQHIAILNLLHTSQEPETNK
jgi:plasmid stabilization system protein ParE